MPIVGSASVHTFARSEMQSVLGELRPRERAAFALAAAERLLPLYGWFAAVESWGEPQVLERALGLGWAWLDGRDTVGSDWESAEEGLDLVTPDTEDFESPLASRALDAACAAAAAVRCCATGEVDAAVEAAEMAWECAFGMEQSLVQPAGEVVVADLAALREAARGGWVTLEEDLQRRSLAAAADGAPWTSERVEDFRRTYGRLGGEGPGLG